MKKIVIPIHSFVDLITNSSSELFVCNTKKSIETIKEILLDLVGFYNKHREPNEFGSKEISKENLFTSILKEPEDAKYTFKYFNFPSELLNEFEKYENPGRHYSCGFGADRLGVEDSDRYKNLEEEERSISRNIGVYEKGLSEEESEKRFEKYQEKRYELWTDWGNDKLKAESALFINFLTSNGVDKKLVDTAKKEIDKSLIEHKKNKRGEYGHIKFDNEKLYELYGEFHMCMGYGISCKKGDIIIYSADDNSIPYEFLDIMSAHLNAQRWHIG